MKLRIVKTHKSSDGNWYYMVQRKYFLLGWLCCGSEDWSAQCLTLKEAEDYVDEIVETKKTNVIVKQITV